MRSYRHGQDVHLSPTNGCQRRRRCLYPCVRTTVYRAPSLDSAAANIPWSVLVAMSNKSRPVGAAWSKVTAEGLSR